LIEVFMDTVLVRRLPAGTRNRLQRQAEQNGRSTEAEARAILLRGLSAGAISLAEVLGSTDTEDIDFDPPPLAMSFRDIEW
jgi:plasmid stability protein